MTIDENEMKRQIEEQIKKSFESSLAQSSKMQEEMLKQMSKNVAGSVNAADLRSCVLNGKTYSFMVSNVEGKKCLLSENYKLVFNDLNKDINANYFDVYNVSLVDDGVVFSGYTLSKIKTTGEFMLYYVNQEGDFFDLYKFAAMPKDEEVCAQAINNHETFKNKALKGVSLSEYLDLRSKTVSKVRFIFEQAKSFKHYAIMPEYKLLLLRFEPVATQYHYLLSVAYDYKDDKFFILNTAEALEFFINTNKMQLSKETGEVISSEGVDLLSWLLAFTSVNQFKELIYTTEDLVHSAHAKSGNPPVNLNQLKKVLDKIRNDVKAPFVEDGVFTALFLNKSGTGQIEKWTVSYADSDKNVSVKMQVLVDDVFVPDFMTEDFTGGQIKYIN